MATHDRCAARSPSIALAVLVACGPTGKDRPRALAPPAIVAPAGRRCARPVLPRRHGPGPRDAGGRRPSAAFVVSPGTSSFVIFSQEAGNSAADTRARVAGVGASRTRSSRRTSAPRTDTLYYDDFAAWPTTPSGATLLRLERAARVRLRVPARLRRTAGPEHERRARAGPRRRRAPARHLEVHRERLGVRTARSRGAPAATAAGRYRVHVVKRPGRSRSAPGRSTSRCTSRPTTRASPLSSAAVAAAHPQIARWKQSLAHYLAKAGIALGTVSFNELPAAVKARYAPAGQVDVSSERSVQRPEPALHERDRPEARGPPVPRRRARRGVGRGRLPRRGRRRLDSRPLRLPGDDLRRRDRRDRGLRVRAHAGGVRDERRPEPLDLRDRSRGLRHGARDRPLARPLPHDRAARDVFDPVSDTARCPCRSCAARASSPGAPR